MLTITTTYRPARVEDCFTIARLFQIAADGVVDYLWSTLQADYPGLTPLEIGAQRFANPDSNCSYRNCVMAERETEIVGMMMTFAIAEPDEAPQAPSTETDSEIPDVMAPYALEKAGTWYICALAVFPEFRGQGIGSGLLALAHRQAREQGFEELSLLCFEQNMGAKQLYERCGFKTIDRTPVVPHPLIHHTGDLLLMTVEA
ncbi:MAG: GNAT family N-acetyltransferase [Cyanobacteria bacterium Co-bin8]|nr:GNAT family N-acetyltransferase [Cyanobacteria bacterium Co-bin8]